VWPASRHRRGCSVALLFAPWLISSTFEPRGFFFDEVKRSAASHEEKNESERLDR
jgi:hypothetical protein